HPLAHTLVVVFVRHRDPAALQQAILPIRAARPRVEREGLARGARLGPRPSALAIVRMHGVEPSAPARRPGSLPGEALPSAAVPHRAPGVRPHDDRAGGVQQRAVARFALAQQARHPWPLPPPPRTGTAITATSVIAICWLPSLRRSIITRRHSDLLR